MVSAFLYLSTCSIKNRILARVRRLREPRYAISLAAGMLYLYGTAFRRIFSGGRTPGLASGAMAQAIGPIELIGSIALFVFAAIAWLGPGSRRGVTFTQAEVQFLFTAPVTRRQLVHYKLLRSQLGLLFGSAISTLFLRPQSVVSAWMLTTGIYLLFTTSSLYLNGVALRRLSMAENGRSGLLKQGLPLLAVGVSVAILAWTVFQDWPTLAGLPDARQVLDEAHRLANTAPAWIVLWPFHTLMALPLSSTPIEFARRLPAVLIMIVLMYMWALQADASFEEASAAQAEKRAAQKSSPRRAVKAGPTPFTLGLTGRPEFAILWKNSILLGRYVSWKMLVRVLPLVVLFVIFMRNGHVGAGMVTVMGFIALALAGYTLLLGPQIARNDLRQDLANIQVLKTWPVSGTELLRGEILAPWVILTVMAWLFLLAGVAFIDPSDIGLTVMDRMSYGVAAMLIAPGFILAQLVVQNSIAVMFPAWISTSVVRARGIDVMGQRLLMMAGVLLTLVGAVAPAAVIAGIVSVVVYSTTHVILVVLPALIVAVVMIIECVVAVELLGGAVDRMDAGSTEPTET